MRKITGVENGDSCKERSAKGAEAHGSTFYMAQGMVGIQVARGHSEKFLQRRVDVFFFTLYIWILNPQNLESNMAGKSLFLLENTRSVDVWDFQCISTGRIIDMISGLTTTRNQLGHQPSKMKI